MVAFKRYILTKPDDSAELLNEVSFIARMFKFASTQLNDKRYHDWCKKVGIPYPVVLQEMNGKEFKMLNVDHLMKYMTSCGFEFEELEHVPNKERVD